MEPGSGEISQILAAARRGEPDALDRLQPLDWRAARAFLFRALQKAPME